MDKFAKKDPESAIMAETGQRSAVACEVQCRA